MAVSSETGMGHSFFQGRKPGEPHILFPGWGLAILWDSVFNNKCFDALPMVSTQRFHNKAMRWMPEVCPKISANKDTQLEKISPILVEVSNKSKFIMPNDKSPQDKPRSGPFWTSEAPEAQPR